MPDAYLLDTSIASYVWDGGSKYNALVKAKLTKLNQNYISICAVSLGEAAYGLEVSLGANPERHTQVKQAMLCYKIYDIDRHTTIYYSRIRGDLFKKYSPRNKRGRLTKKWPEDLVDDTTAQDLGIQENDLWIVSVAVQYNLIFLTGDANMHPILTIAKSVYSYDRYEIWNLDDEYNKINP